LNREQARFLQFVWIGLSEFAGLVQIVLGRRRLVGLKASSPSTLLGTLSLSNAHIEVLVVGPPPQS
jgi:hypothetical protein